MSEPVSSSTPHRELEHLPTGFRPFGAAGHFVASTSIANEFLLRIEETSIRSSPGLIRVINSSRVRVRPLHSWASEDARDQRDRPLVDHRRGSRRSRRDRRAARLRTSRHPRARCLRPIARRAAHHRPSRRSRRRCRTSAIPESLTNPAYETGLTLGSSALCPVGGGALHAMREATTTTRSALGPAMAS